MTADRSILERIGRVIYEARHAGDHSAPWNDLSDDRRWFWRNAASEALIEIAAVADELDAAEDDAEREAQARADVRRAGTSRTIRLMTRAG